MSKKQTLSEKSQEKALWYHKHFLFIIAEGSFYGMFTFTTEDTWLCEI